MRITFLGTATSQGIPVIACNCDVCQSTDIRDKRLRSSVLINIENNNIVIDTGPDFRQQMLNNHVTYLTAVIFTHEHKDHVAGLDDIRPFNFIHHKPIDIYAEARVQESLKNEYAYIFLENPYPGAPQIEMHLLENKPFYINNLEVIPVRAFHHELPVFGFRIGNFAYLTDIKFIADEEKQKLKGLKVFVINSLRKEEHISHFNLDEALALIDEIKPQSAYLTHLSHRFGLHAEEEKNLPDSVYIAYDGLTIDI
jgi:phosphoribosyl 1,2-cyclic phosphate phosphodiesterase